MTYTRQFLVSPALARLIRKELGTQGRVREGYFSSTSERTHFVRLDPPHCTLMMVAQGSDGEPIAEATEVPLSQAQALLDVAPGRIAYERTALVLAPGIEGVLEQILVSRPFHLLAITMEDDSDAECLPVPDWAGPEVSGDPAFSKAAIALEGEPEVGEVGITNAALEALLDLLQSRSSLHRMRAFPAPGSWSDRTDQTNPVSEQLLAGLAHALDQVGGEAAKSKPQIEAQAYPTLRRVSRTTG